MTDSSRRAFLHATAAASMISATGIAHTVAAVEETKMSTKALEDMYEHAYQMDYGAAAPKYIDAFFTNIQWDAVAKRI